MRILYWTSGFWPRIGGIETHSLTLVTALKQRGHQCVVITNQDLPSWQQQTNYAGITIHRYPFKAALQKNTMTLTGKILRDIKQMIAEFKPEVIHLNLGISAHIFFYNFIKKCINVPTVLTLHGLLCLEQAYKKQIDSVKRYTSLFNTCAWITTVSKALIDELEIYLPINQYNITYIHNSLPSLPLQPQPLSFKPNKIFCVGRLTYEKGFEVAIAAFAILKKTIPHVEMTIVGDDDEMANLQRLVNTLQLEASINFLGMVPQRDVLPLINEATLVIVPSHYEAFGVIALEAAMLAKPVIASKVGGLKEIIEHGKTGLLVEKNNIAAFSKAMVDLLSNPNKTTDMGLAAREHVIENFSVRQMVTRYESVYSQSIKSPKILEASHEQIYVN